MTHTDLTSVVALTIFDLTKDNKGILGINDVLFGNQTMVPRSPCVIITPGPKRRELAGVSAPGGRTLNHLIVYIDVLTSRVGVEAEERLALDQLSENVEKIVHADTTLGGIIIHGFIGEWEPGETFIQDTQFRLVRMTFEGQSKTYLSA